MLKFNGYRSCWTCLIPGEKEGRKATIFPYILWEKFPPRSDEYYRYCVDQIEKDGLDQFGGHKGSSCFVEMEGPTDKVVPETFHNLVGVVQTIWKDLKDFGVNKKQVDKDLMYSKMTTELKVEQTFLGKKGPIRMTQWLNLLLYISIPLLAINGASDLFISHWFLLVNFAAKLNQKMKGIKVEELFTLHKGICVFVSFCKQIYGDKRYWTSKMHSLLHTISFVIRYGLFWNWSAKVFESALFPIKQAAIHSKINAILSVENKLLNIFTLFQFKNFTAQHFVQYGVPSVTAEFLAKNISSKGKDEKIPRNGTRKLVLIVNDHSVEFISCNKRVHEPTGEVIAAHFHCTGTTNNQIVVLEIDGQEIFAKIEGIQRTGTTIAFRRAIHNPNPAIDIARITNKYCVWISSWGCVEIGEWDNIKEKVVAFKVRDSWFATKIYR